MYSPLRTSAIDRRRRDPRRVVRLSRVLPSLCAIGAEEDREAISTAARAAEYIQFYWPKVYERYVRRLPVTPASLYAVTYLFLELADGRLLDLYPWWDESVQGQHPFRNFKRRLQKRGKDLLETIYEARPNIWAPEPVVYGLDLEWLTSSMPDRRFVLPALMWKLWQRNPIYFPLMPIVAGGDDPAEICQEPGAEAIVAAIKAIPPLPPFSGREAIDAFWARLEHIDLGTHPAHLVSLASALEYPLMMTDNQFANTSTAELHESYDTDYGIQWNDPVHVAAVREQQEIGLAYAETFWELNFIVAEYPPLISQIGELMHAIAAEIREQFPSPDPKQLRKEIAAALDRPEVPVFGQLLPEYPDTIFEEEARNHALLETLARQGLFQEVLPGLEAREEPHDRASADIQPAEAAQEGEAVGRAPAPPAAPGDLDHRPGAEVRAEVL